MPKLNKALTKKVDSSEATHGFSLITPGKYWGRLSEVRVDKNRNDTEVWVAEFQDLTGVESGERIPGRQWLRMNLPQDENDVPADYTKGPEKWKQAQGLSAGRIKAFFEAFGYEVDSDTDEMINEWAVITVGIRTIQAGARKGERTNDVTDIEPGDDYGDQPEASSDTTDY